MFIKLFFVVLSAVVVGMAIDRLVWAFIAWLRELITLQRDVNKSKKKTNQ